MITEFLLARIAEDESELDATVASAKQMEDFSFGGTDDYLQFTMGFGRAVAECAAKRVIIEGCTAVDDWQDEYAVGLRDDTLRALAAVYSDHPGYQEEWKQ